MAGTYEMRGDSVRFRYTGKGFPSPIYETFHGLTGKREIDRRLATWVRDVESGEWHRRRTRRLVAASVEDLFESWLASGGVRLTTLKGYRNLVANYVNPVIGKLRIEEVTPPHCQEVVKRMREMGRSAKTIVNAHRVMTAAFNVAVRQGLRADNPADHRKVMTPRLEERLHDVPDPEKVNRILQAAGGGPYYAAILLAAETGLRRGELLGLRWADMDLELGRAGVKQTVFAVGPNVDFADPKTRRSRRTVGLTPRAVAALRQHHVAQSERRLSFGTTWADQDLVFDRGDGRPVHPDVFSRYFSRLIKRNGLGRVRLHDLRHAFATNLMRIVGTKDTSAALGHTSEAFTMRVYQHLVPDVNAALVAEAISRVYGVGE